MASSHRSRVIVTPRAVDLQVQIIKDKPFPSSEPPSPRLSPHPHHARNNSTSSTTSHLPSYFFPTRPGYFGPKTSKSISIPSPISISTSKETSLYPNYLKRDPKEYPPKHICMWNPKSIVQGPTHTPREIPNGKYVHHTLYVDNNGTPKMDQLNNMVYGKGIALPINLTASEEKNWSNLQKISEMDVHRTVSASQSQTNFYSPKFASTGFSKFSMQSPRDFEGKDDRVLRKHLENERNYQKLLVRFDEEAKRKLNRYQENQHEAPEFETKMKAGNKHIKDLEAVRSHEDVRLTTRLKTLQKRKYEGYWTKHEGFFEKNLLMSNRDGKSTVKKEEEVMVSVPIQSARESLSIKEGEKTISRGLTINRGFTKKVSIIENEEEKNNLQIAREKMKSESIVKRKFEVK